MSENYRIQEEKIQNWLKTQKNRKKGDIQRAAQELGVPYRRLQQRCAGRSSRIGRPPPNKRLSPGQSDALLDWVFTQSKQNLYPTPRMIGQTANHLLEVGAQEPDGVSPTAQSVSKSWVSRWISAQKGQVAVRTQKPFDLTRYLAQNKAIIGSWYDELSNIIAEYGILPDDIWNVDESGFRFGQGKRSRVVVPSHIRKPEMPSCSGRESITLIEAIAASGRTIQPMIILPGKVVQAHWVKAELPANYMLGVTETGFNNDQMMLAWIQHFNRLTQKGARGTHRLLLLDGFGSHLTLELIEYCQKEAIIPFQFPPHMTHLMQPLDVSVFQPYKHWHAQFVDTATRSGYLEYKKINFLADLAEIRRKTLKEATIRSGFAKTGIWPTNKHAVLEKIPDLDTLVVPEAQIEQETAQLRGFNPSTPKKASQFQEFGQLLGQTIPDELPHTDPIRIVLAKLVKGSIQVSSSEALIRRDWEKQQIEQKKHYQIRRSYRDGRQMQKGGVISAQDLRKAVQKRNEEDAQKGENQSKKAKPRPKKVKEAKEITQSSRAEPNLGQGEFIMSFD